MKKTHQAFLAAAVAAVCSIAFRTLPPDDGVVGEVRYSILEPSKFQELNGTGWQLLEGQSVHKDERLCTKGEYCLQLPDARGVFIRGVNGARDPKRGDPAGTARKVGSSQGDSLGAHTHDFANELRQAGHSIIGNGHPARLMIEDGGPYNRWVWDMITNPTGGSETRPRNIALYVYIKVN